jgi:multisubunit Na+/H+ antiporter MnhE subunit
MFVVSLGRVFWARIFFGVSLREWVKSVLVPCGIVCACSVFSGIAIYWIIPSSFVRLIYIFASCFFVSIITTWYIAFNNKEREFFMHNIKLILNKIGHLLNIN